MNVFLKAACSLALLAGANSCFAQYRCGNSFQDFPCSSGNNAKQTVVTKNNVETAATPNTATQSASAFAVVCGRWGKSALDVAWKREAGALRETQITKPAGEISSKDHTFVVDSVYAKRGTAPTIRNAVEAECLIQKQQEADEAAALAAMARKSGGNNGNVPNLVQNDAGSQPPTAGNAKAQQAVKRKEKCLELEEQLIDVKKNARRGGKIGTMEKLNDERRRLEQKISQSAC